MVAVIDMTGREFGRLRVVRRAETGRPVDGVRWVLQCAPDLGGCGSPTFTVSGRDLRRGRTRSCGCYRIEVATAQLAKIGQAAAPSCQWCQAVLPDGELMPVLFAVEEGGSGMQCRDNRACNRRRKQLTIEEATRA